MVGDPVGDFIVRLANATAIKKASVSVPFSAFKMATAEKLKDAGFLKSIEKKGKKVRKTMDIALKYDEAGNSAIEGVKRISKPGRRMYRNAREAVPRRYGRGALLLPTPT